MATAAAGRAAAAVAAVSTSSESGSPSLQGPRAHHVACARPPHSAGLHPRLVAFSSFFGAGIDRSVVVASNGSGPWTVASVVNEIAVDGTSNSSATKLEVPSSETKPGSSELPSSADSSLESAASVFMADVANLVKLVDSRDIVELELKHKDYEILIRKKEALAPPPAPQQSSFSGPHVMGHTMFPQFSQGPPPPLPQQEAPAPATTAPPPTPDVVTPPAAEYPAMLSPMAGTFYRSPAPGEGSFVKVGDKITKGQVVCIVEAMKLMNEIEADQSGTIMDILAEDCKPVSIETPLFVIKP